MSESISLPSLENENPSRVVWALAWPAVALNSLQVVNTLLDRGFIGHLQTSALTAHGGATNVMFLMFSLAMALGTAGTAIVARAFGAGNQNELREASNQTVRLAGIAGIAALVLCVAITPTMSTVVLPRSDPEAMRLMREFLFAYAISLPAVYMIQVLAGGLRGVGDTRSPMVISGIQIGLHIAFNVVLIPKMGLQGAAHSLSASAWIAAVGYLLFVRRTPLGASHPFRLPDLGWAKRILRIAIPAAGMALLRVLSFTTFTIILTGVPNASVAIAALSVAIAIESIMFMPPFGLSMAAGALVGQSLGMRKPDRASRLGWIAGHHGGLVTLLISIPIFAFSMPLSMALVGDKPDVAQEASSLLRILILTEVLFSYSMVLAGALQGAGDTVRPMWVSLISLWLLRVPLAWALAIPLGYGATGAWIAMSASQAVAGTLTIWLWHRGGWKETEV